MDFQFDNYLFACSKSKQRANPHSCYFGLEREALRLNAHGKLSQTPHPFSLGSPLTHPYIGTDYGEAQLEWNTPSLPTLARAELFLRHLMVHTQKEVEGVLFWPYSLPCPLPSKIQRARYGSSHQGQKKNLYRAGLKKRYGDKRQMISGIHFNFSFAPSFWEALYQNMQPQGTLSSFINTSYLKMIRTFLWEGWLLTYLFGATPAVDNAYLNPHREKMKKHLKKTLYGEFATSIRMSRYGYYGQIENQPTISFNTLKEYITDMEWAISTPQKTYQKIKNQLNDHIFQIENEHYARIRPKCNLQEGESPLEGIKNRGIEYVEIRSLDINPFLPTGIDRETLTFLHLFLLYSLFETRTVFDEEDIHSLTTNQNTVALYGRDPTLILQDKDKTKKMRVWAEQILTKMHPIATLLGPSYLGVLTLQNQKITCPHLTLSGRIVKKLQKSSQEITTFCLDYANKHKQVLTHKTIPKKVQKTLHEATTASHLEVQVLETASKVLVPGYETLELSTQILIREALKQGITIEVLDSKDHFLKLQKGAKIEYVKQATKTSKDSYIVRHILGNKHVTKQILAKKGLSVPQGELYTCFAQAMAAYSHFAHQKVVIKPKSTNCGVGVFFISPGEKKRYALALQEGFRQGNSVIIESFCEGKEYRFLIIGKKVVSVVHRMPAHVIGDGTHTIKELIYLKNHNPSFYRPPSTHLLLGPEEKAHLQTHALSPSHIPAKRKRVFLRDNSNVSTGGDAIDVTDRMEKSYKSIALKATAEINAQICGVDMMIPSLKQEATRSNYAIIELNHNPVLFIHAFPCRGKKKNVAKPLLELLGF